MSDKLAEMIQMYCVAHPTYQARVEPYGYCLGCWHLFELNQQRLELFDPAPDTFGRRCP